MLKIGAYGFIRFSMPILPDASQYLAWPMIILSLIAIVYVGLIAVAQSDMKKLIAYSSVAHMGFVTLGLFAVYLIIANTGNHADAHMSLEGGVVQMISHAFSSGALFLAFGLLYEQMHTRQISDFGGIANTMPRFTAFFMVFAMSNVALPGTSGFVGEFMVLLSSVKANFWITVVAGLTLIIGAVYTLSMFKRVFYGPVANEHVAALKDISKQDTLLFVLLTAAIVIIGLYPAPLLNVMHTSVSQLLELSMQSKI
jgi:NADH-quinone oxidoreductase subunit M